MIAVGNVVEIRLHGRGGQGGVTCAKIIAAIYARLGKAVQTFGDYSGERSGAPIRAYTRIADRTITNRNKVYAPHHVVILDPTLLGDDSTSGLAPGGTLLLNTPNGPEAFAAKFSEFRVATVDATGIARRHKIGTRSVVIVNTTIVGAFAKALGIPLDAMTATYQALGFASNLPSAKEAYETVLIREASTGTTARVPSPPPNRQPVMSLVDHVESPAPALKTGNWRTQKPGYVTNPAPCNAFCPAGNDVIGFVQALAHMEVCEASTILARTTPLSAVCGRVCPAPCMEGCNRREFDGSVNIRGLERWVADRIPVAEVPGPAAPGGRKIAILGGGPAGLSAAYELARAGHRVTIFEGEKGLGGVLRTGIPSYRLPREVVDREVDAILRLGVEARCGTFLDRAAIAKLPEAWDGVILATGLQKLRGLDGPGGDLKGVEQGIRFLHRVNHGGAPLSGHVVVLGGGNTAMDCARSARRSGADRVTIAYRRTREEMPAIREEIDEAVQEGIEMLFLRAPIGFQGKNRVEKVELAEVELGPPDATGRRSPVVTPRRSSLACDHVLLALGQSADLSLLPGGWELREGQIHHEGRPLNVFAAGDVATGDGTVAHAIGDGRRVAGRLLQSLGVRTEIFERPDRSKAVPVTDLRLDHFQRAPGAKEELLPVEPRLANFAEVSRGLGDVLESHRCFSCGHCTRCDTCLVYCPEGIIRRKDAAYEIDYSYCKGCGICVTECPRKAMEMTST